ncbi:hypothetical protein GUJ93_ZPchr0005g15192 [Zizania palustris]|uniref:Uncharacterized protein n=1 Tax=Zizania palustris TaxID=103762 RepID=A0A8J5SHG2_ZIZPA|nr:hypothetical protein GUJ93_ZPchr0005g15192 [Zizania palustris]
MAMGYSLTGRGSSYPSLKKCIFLLFIPIPGFEDDFHLSPSSIRRWGGDAVGNWDDKVWWGVVRVDGPIMTWLVWRGVAAEGHC